MENNTNTNSNTNNNRKFQKATWYIFAFIVVLLIVSLRCPSLTNENGESVKIDEIWVKGASLALLEASFFFYLLISGFSFVISGLLRDQKIERRQKIGLVFGFLLYSGLSYIIIHSLESNDFGLPTLSAILGVIGIIVVMVDTLIGLDKKIIRQGILYTIISFVFGVVIPVILYFSNKDFLENAYFIAFQSGIIAFALIIVNAIFDPFNYKDIFDAKL